MASAQAQTQLRLLGVPSSLRLGLPVTGQLERVLADGGTLPPGQPATTVALTSSSPLAQFAQPAPAPAYQSSLAVSFAFNAAVSAQFLIRDGRVGTSTLNVDGGSLPATSFAYRVDPHGFAEDFETGDFSRWEVRAPNTNFIILSVTDGGHRGRYAMRVDDVSGAGGGTAGPYVAQSFTPVPNNLYVRTWFALLASNRANDIIPLNCHPGPNGGPPVTDLRLLPGGAPQVGGNTPSGYVYSPITPNRIDDGGWHLLEMATLGMGSDAGQLLLWVDGQPPTFTSVDLSGLTIFDVAAGLSWTASQAFMGTYLFDDLRVSATPPASQVGVSFPNLSVSQGDCAPFDVSLRDSTGLAAEAPYDLQVAVSFVRASGPYADSVCTSNAGTVSISYRASGSTAFFRPEQLGTGTASANHPDFLSASPASFNVVQFNLPDGGGSSLPDGGPDTGAGEFDAGTPEAGAPFAVAVGCGCDSSGAALLALAMLGLLPRPRLGASPRSGGR